MIENQIIENKKIDIQMIENKKVERNST